MQVDSLVRIEWPPRLPPIGISCRRPLEVLGFAKNLSQNYHRPVGRPSAAELPTDSGIGCKEAPVQTVVAELRWVELR